MTTNPPRYFAHSDANTGRKHRLEDHLREVGRMAAEFAGSFGSAEWGRAGS